MVAARVAYGIWAATLVPWTLGVPGKFLVDFTAGWCEQVAWGFSTAFGVENLMLRWDMSGNGEFWFKRVIYIPHVCVNSQWLPYRPMDFIAGVA